MPSASALSPVQALVFALLNGDSTLTGMAKIYDHVPEQTSFPYISLTDFNETPDDTLGTLGRAIDVTIEAWSQAEGYKELEAITNRIVTLLDNDAAGSPTGWTLVGSLYSSGDLVRESDGLTRHATMMFKLEVTQP